MYRRKLKKVPKFRSEKEELEFWATHDSTEYIDYSKAKGGIIPKPEAIDPIHLHQAAGVSY